MSINSLAHLYEESTISTSRDIITRTLDNHLPPLRPDMHILDLACGSGSVTRIIHEHCAATGINPPQITAIDIGPGLIDAFNENKAARGWHTAHGIVADAADLSMCGDDSFDLIIMSFGLFAVQDAVADKVAAEMYRVLKPGGKAAVTTWRTSWVARMYIGASNAVGRPAEEAKRWDMGSWMSMEKGRDTLVAGGFPSAKVECKPLDYFFEFEKVNDFVDMFSTPFWLGLGTGHWTDEQKSQWRGAVEGLLTKEEKESGKVDSHIWLYIANK